MELNTGSSVLIHKNMSSPFTTGSNHLGRMSRLVLLIVWFESTVTNGQAGNQSVGFVLNEVAYPNGSTVLMTDIGERDAALMCTTDRAGCCGCQKKHTVEFYFPNGTKVCPLSTLKCKSNYYRTRGSGFIRLNRLPSGTETGEFHCVIPDTNGMQVDLTIYIVDIIVTIVPSGINAAGENYSLLCSATVIGSNDVPTIMWLDSMNTIPSEMVTTNASTSTLVFNPLAASQAGTYTCTVTVGSLMRNETVTVTALNPTIYAIADSGVAAPKMRLAYSMNCTVTGAEKLIDATIAYQWFKDGDMVQGQTMETLFFPALSSADAGGYTCRATVMSSLLSAPITISTTSVLFIDLISTSVPVDVQATQCSPSDPVEVSWSPPSSAISNITGYRIYYGNGENVTLPSVVTHIGLSMNADAVGQNVSIQSEANHQLLVSELVTVTIDEDRRCKNATTEALCSSSNDVIGECILLACLVILCAVIATLLICWCRRRKASKDNLATSPNMEQSMVYDYPNMHVFMPRSTAQGNYEMTQCPAYGSAIGRPQSQGQTEF